MFGNVLAQQTATAAACHLKLIPHLRLILGVCIYAIDSNSGTSFSESCRGFVMSLRRQGSVSSRNAANVSDCR